MRIKTFSHHVIPCEGIVRTSYWSLINYKLKSIAVRFLEFVSLSAKFAKHQYLFTLSSLFTNWNNVQELKILFLFYFSAHLKAAARGFHLTLIWEPMYASTLVIVHMFVPLTRVTKGLLSPLIWSLTSSHMPKGTNNSSSNSSNNSSFNSSSKNIFKSTLVWKTCKVAILPLFSGSYSATDNIFRS